MARATMSTFALPSFAAFATALEAARRASIGTMVDVPVLCPAATPGIMRFLPSRIRATAVVPNLRANDAAELYALPDGGGSGGGGGWARVTSGTNAAGSVAGHDKDADTGGDAGSGSGGPHTTRPLRALHAHAAVRHAPAHLEHQRRGGGVGGVKVGGEVAGRVVGSGHGRGRGVCREKNHLRALRYWPGGMG